MQGKAAKTLPTLSWTSGSSTPENLSGKSPSSKAPSATTPPAFARIGGGVEGMASPQGLALGGVPALGTANGAGYGPFDRPSVAPPLPGLESGARLVDEADPDPLTMGGSGGLVLGRSSFDEALGRIGKSSLSTVPESEGPGSQVCGKRSRGRGRGRAG